MAASKALTCILKVIPKGCMFKSENDGRYEIPKSSVLESLNEKFDVDYILGWGHRYLAYTSEEDETTNEKTLNEQKTRINTTLGLNFTASKDLDVDNEIITDHDLAPDTSNKLSPQKCEVNENKLSARQKNIMRRKERAKKRKQDANSRSKLDSFNDDSSVVKKFKSENKQELFRARASSGNDIKLENDMNWGDVWPFTNFTEFLFNDLQNHNWEIRHGAATALREIILHQGTEGGRTCYASNENQNDQNNEIWLRNTARLLICVIANDRFGDFISDQVVAPVRETSSMALGSVIKILCHKHCYDVIRVLIALLDQEEWQTRHGSILAIKYFLVARPPSESENNRHFLNDLFPGITKALNDPVDDVVASAASSLIPVVHELCQIPSSGNKITPYLHTILDWLWNSLEDIDELSSSTQSILKLLSIILKDCFDNVTTRIQETSLNYFQNTSLLITRILPFLYHSSTSVRNSALETMCILVSHDRLANQFLNETAGPILKHLFQQALLEHNAKNLQILESIWNIVCDKTSLEPLLLAACPLYGSWLNILTQQSTKPLPDHFFVHPPPNEPKYIGGNEAQHETDREVKNNLVMRARCLGVRLLGKLACFIMKPVPGMDYSKESQTPIEMIVEKIILPVLNNGKSAYTQFIVSLVISEWSICYKSTNIICLSVPGILKETLNRLLVEKMNYEETISLQRNLQFEASDFLKNIKSTEHFDFNMIKNKNSESDLSIDEIRALATYDMQIHPNGPIKEELVEKQCRIQNCLTELQENYLHLNIMASSGIAGAIIDIDGVGEKLNPIIKPIMESVKTQQNTELQNCSIEKVPNLIELCINRGLTHIAEKIMKNLTHFASSSIEETHDSNQIDADSLDTCNIISLRKMKLEESKQTKRSSKSKKHSNPKAGDIDVVKQELIVQKRGANKALKSVVNHFRSEIATLLPNFWNLTIKCFQTCEQLSEKELVVSLQALEILVPELAKYFQSTLKELLIYLSKLVMHNSAKVRNLVAKCYAVLATSSVGISSEVLLKIHDDVLPLLHNIENLHYRQGAIEVTYLLTTNLGLEIIPFIVILIVPVLGRMSDINEDVRFLANRTFAILVKLIPLDNIEKDNDLSLTPVLLEKKHENQKFVDELLDPIKCIKAFKVPVDIRANLRSYQLDGVKWLGFLDRYNLHGILCDDMGLGKTLQTITMVASSHFRNITSQNSSYTANNPSLPSLVICPSTVCGHWKEEIRKFVADPQHLDGIIYGQKSFINNRNGNRDGIKKHIIDLITNGVKNLVVITSYDIVRSDIDFFKSMNWNYMVLDEGHIIKNSKSKTTKAIKAINASHRLILSGTPIQNSVLDLWSLFDFLMPGFLGSERQFNNNYSKPIISSRNSKEKGVQERAALAVESLHRQVLPFIMRRMKNDVLKDLPPKIIQDHYCELSPIQQHLYEECLKKEKKKPPKHSSRSSPLEEEALEKPTDDNPLEESIESHHVFQTLQYLRKVCNHPKLVLDSQKYHALVTASGFDDVGINDISNSGKLPALKELLLQCGIGMNKEVEDTEESGAPYLEDTASVVGQHRALIFFQLKSMIDIVEHDLIKKQMPSVAYLRLDGSVPTSMRHSIVQKFNKDVTIDVLLLTTSVGGLGLNLTGADTVIFVEQDWNPMKDLQAMDRAHRIGQKKVVNVYRLISKGTIEEKILGIQQFKLKTANTVISADNSSMKNMMHGSDPILETFSSDHHQEENNDKMSPESKKGIKAIMDSLPELWDDKLYEEEYNVTSFDDKLT